jgi:hypothetical protein
MLRSSGTMVVACLGILVSGCGTVAQTDPEVERWMAHISEAVASADTGAEETTETAAKDQPAPAQAAPALVIVRAVYGDLQSARIVDVTEKVMGMVTADGLAVVASNSNFGDPAGGTVKQLMIEYTLDGEQMAKTVMENETLTIGLVE